MSCKGNPAMGIKVTGKEMIIKCTSLQGYSQKLHLLRIINILAFIFFCQFFLGRFKTKLSNRKFFLNGPPLFTGDADSRESNIRKWLIENDWLEAIVAMPTELFYNTWIATCIWIVANRKPKKIKGKIQLINEMSVDMKVRKGSSKKVLSMTILHFPQILQIFNLLPFFQSSIEVFLYSFLAFLFSNLKRDIDFLKGFTFWNNGMRKISLDSQVGKHKDWRRSINFIQSRSPFTVYSLIGFRL